MTHDSERPVGQTVDSREKTEVTHKTGTSPSGRDERLYLLLLREKELLERQNLRLLAPSFLHMSQKKSMQSRRKLCIRLSQQR